MKTIKSACAVFAALLLQSVCAQAQIDHHQFLLRSEQTSDAAPEARDTLEPNRKAEVPTSTDYKNAKYGSAVYILECLKIQNRIDAIKTERQSKRELGDDDSDYTNASVLSEEEAVLEKELAIAEDELKIAEGKVHLTLARRNIAPILMSLRNDKLHVRLQSETADDSSYEYKHSTVAFNDAYYNASNRQLFSRFDFNYAVGAGTQWQNIGAELYSDYFGVVRVGLNAAMAIVNADEKADENEKAKTSKDATLQNILNNGGNFSFTAQVPLFLSNPLNTYRRNWIFKGFTTMMYARGGLSLKELSPDSEGEIDTILPLKDNPTSGEIGLSASANIASSKNVFGLYFSGRLGLLYSDQRFERSNMPGKGRNTLFVAQTSLTVAIEQTFMLSIIYYSDFDALRNEIPLQLGVRFIPRF